jgi:hypothetical protein
MRNSRLLNTLNTESEYVQQDEAERSSKTKGSKAHVSIELQKQLVNAITKSDWPRFSGQGKYDHMDFIHWIDTAKRDSLVPDMAIILKLLTILEGVALS